MADGLSLITQDDFSAGAFPGASRDLIPRNGLEDAKNALIDDDGLPVRRGGSVMKSNADLLSAVDSSVVGARLLWDGYLTGGRRTLVVANSNVSVLDTDDATPVRLGGFPLEGATALALHIAPYPTKPAYLNGVVVFPNGVVYGGSRKLANYSTGTISITPGSTTLTGVGTAWLANVDKGMIFSKGGRHVPVRSITSDTSLELAFPWREEFGTLSGATYSLEVLASVTQVASDASPLFASVGGRLLIMYGSRLYVGVIGMADMTTLDYHDVVGDLLGAEALRDQAVVFTTTGITVISNIALDLTDEWGNPQRRQEEVNRDIILWSWAGVASYLNRLIVPAVDGIWLFDTSSQPRLISTGIATQYKAYVDAGHHAGLAAVHNGHYFLPILDSANAVVDLLVCRLQGTRHSRGEVFAWTRFNGAASNVAALAVRAAESAARQPYLMGGDATSGRILKLPFWASSGADHDATVYVTELVTREFRADNTLKMFAQRLATVYEMVNAAGVSTLDVAVSVDGGAWIDLSSDGPESTLSSNPTIFFARKRGRAVRFRIRTTGAATRFALHVLKLYVRVSGRR